MHQMIYHLMMRTTLDIDDDVLSAAKELAAQMGSTAGRVLSSLARDALTGGYRQTDAGAVSLVEAPAVYGFKPFPKNGSVITNELIDRINDQEGI